MKHKVFSSMAVLALIHVCIGSNTASSRTSGFRPASFIAKKQQQELALRRRQGLLPANDLSLHTVEQLNVQGGGGASPVNKNVVAKVATIVSLIQGVMAFFNPKSAASSWGMATTTPIDVITMRRLGVVLCQMGTIGVSLFFFNQSVNTAIGTASLGFVIEIVRSTLADEHNTIGFGLPPQLAVLVQCAVVSYINLSNKKYAALANKINAIWLLLNGIMFGFLPEFVLKTGWGIDGDLDPKTVGFVSGFGMWFLSYAVLIAGLAWDMDGIQALTWNRLLILLIPFITTNGESVGVTDTKRRALLIYQAAIWAGLAM